MASAASAVSAPSRAEVLGLLRSLLRTAAKFSDYNVREYVRRRSLDGFRENKELYDPAAAAAAFAAAKSQLEVARRQAVVYSLYAPKVKSVLEIKSI
ncbi:LYR motif-containing protein 4 [Ananas comosus]|uniref:LYR motif-containing protein 4 n=1 Tax=Ananas comosus TaxID=4615 RepID=A0A199W565_ANACO|nr:LYR motif-containing protein 4 [Ananas comosus]XP_020095191.1 LYR motif-containing protein 4 [Ananas comosus]OAY84055.1 LYR motif-containing protein 4 [Ananas comosus]